MIYASDKRHGQVAVVEMVVVVVDVIVAVAAVVAVEVVITADGAAGGNGGGGAADKQLCKVLSVLCIMHRFQHAARCNSDRPIRNGSPSRKAEALTLLLRGAFEERPGGASNRTM